MHHGKEMQKMATWPSANKRSAESPQLEEPRHATLVLEHEKKSKSWGNRRDANARTESTEFLTTSLERDGCAMSDVSSFHTQSTLSDLQPSVRLSATAQHPLFRYFKLHSLTAGHISMLVMLLLMIVGMALVAGLGQDESYKVRVACHVLRAAGLFGLTGGFTNWIGIRMIFSGRRGPFCSGVVARNFVDTRKCIANFILEAFFNSQNIRLYVHEMTSSYLTPEVFGEQVDRLLESEAADRITEKQLQNLMCTPEGFKLQAMGVTKTKLKPLVKSYVSHIKTEIIPLVLPVIQSLDLVKADKIREQVADLVATRTQQLSAGQVRQVVRDAVYRHLAWLVFWGNFLGALMGGAVELLSIQLRGLPT